MQFWKKNTRNDGRGVFRCHFWCTVCLVSYSSFRGPFGVKITSSTQHTMFSNWRCTASEQQRRYKNEGRSKKELEIQDCISSFLFVWEFIEVSFSLERLFLLCCCWQNLYRSLKINILRLSFTMFFLWWKHAFCSTERLEAKRLTRKKFQKRREKNGLPHSR